jgi:hypothetical protein
MDPAAPLFELKEGLRVSDAALLADTPPKLSKIEDVVTDSAFVAENPGYQADDWESADDLGCDCDRGVGVSLHVRQDQGRAARVPRRGGDGDCARGEEARERRDGGGEGEGAHWHHQVAGECYCLTAGSWNLEGYRFLVSICKKQQTGR